MELSRFFNVWTKYQLSLNWLNILFRYSVKLLVLVNVAIITVSATYEFKHTITQFKFLIAVLVLTDLILKFTLKKKHEDLRALHLIPEGVNFLLKLNILRDIISLRNLLLPFLTMGIILILDLQPGPSLFYLFVVSCSNSIVAGYRNKRKRNTAGVTAIVLILATLCFGLNVLLINLFSTLVFIVLVYFRYREKMYPEENILNPSQTPSTENIGNQFLWLDFQILKKSRHLQLTFLKVIGICLLYCYIISTKYSHQQEIGFDLILLIQIYYSFVPVLLIPYILSSNNSYIGLLFTLPNLKSFFMTKLNAILLFQFLLTLVLYALNHNNVQIVMLISAISIFNIFIITPIMFMGLLLTDEKINIFDSRISSFLFIPSFGQSLYFLGVLVCAAVVLFLLQTIGLDYFSWILIGLSIIAFFKREMFIRFFQFQYQNKKYKLFKILS